MSCDPKTCVVSNNGQCVPLCADYAKRNQIDAREYCGRMADGAVYLYHLPCKTEDNCKKCKFGLICLQVSVITKVLSWIADNKAVKK